MAMLLTKESAEEYLKEKRYKKLNYLGKGAFNMVFKGESPAGDEVAIKLISDTEPESMDREVQATKEIQKLKKPDPDKAYKNFSEELADAVKNNAGYRKHIINPILKIEDNREISKDLIEKLIDDAKSDSKKQQLKNWSKKQQEEGKGPFKAKTYVFEAKLLKDDLEKFEGPKDSEMLFPLVKKVSKGICKTLKVLHDKNTVHLDVKSDNVFSSNGKTVLPKFKLGDYGTAINDKTDYDLSTNGDLLLKLVPGFPSDYKVNKPSIEELKKVDIYCMGETILEFFARRYNEKETGNQTTGPFSLPKGKSYAKNEFKTAKDTFKRLMNEDKIDKENPQAVKDFWELIVNTTCDNPSKRWTVDQVLSCNFCRK